MRGIVFAEEWQRSKLLNEISLTDGGLISEVLYYGHGSLREYGSRD
jgi:hypothetical protein